MAEPKIRKRNPLLAAILYLVNAGLGFLYVGKPVLAVIFALISIFLIGLTTWTGLAFYPHSFYAAVAIIFSISILGLVWVITCALRSKPEPLKKYQRWYFYIGLFLVAVILFQPLLANRDQVFGYDMFRFPSGSMADTLLNGDYVIVNTWAYRNDDPNRGDVIVFRFPGDRTIKYLKRIIAIGGDTIEMKDGMTLVNNIAIKEPYLNKKYTERTETDHFPPAVVPKDHYFVLGDNRDHSNDSRYWGFVPASDVLGKTEFVWFSYGKAEGIRWERLGHIVK
jgi:signal peptidase I